MNTDMEQSQVMKESPSDIIQIIDNYTDNS
jgi:hypothetical protein